MEKEHHRGQSIPITGFPIMGFASFADRTGFTRSGQQPGFHRLEMGLIPFPHRFGDFIGREGLFSFHFGRIDPHRGPIGQSSPNPS